MIYTTSAPYYHTMIQLHRLVKNMRRILQRCNMSIMMILLIHHYYSLLVCDAFQPSGISSSHTMKHIALHRHIMNPTATATSTATTLAMTTTATRHYPQNILCLHQASNDSLEMKKGQTIDVTAIQSFGSAGILILIDILFRRLFLKYHISFPSSLGACGVLLSMLLFISNKTDMIYKIVQPGSVFLAKWLPVFFVPSLITLPLTGSVGSSIELIKITTVIVIGFIISLLTSSGSVVAIRQLLSSVTTTSTSTSSSSSSSSSSTNAASAGPKKPPFTDRLFYLLLTLSVGSGIGAIVANGSNTIVATLFLLSSTLTSFVWGTRLPKSCTKLIHPLVTCTGMTWLVLSLFGQLTGQTFTQLLRSYRQGAKLSMNSGAGDILLFLLGPAVVSLATSMYERRKYIRDQIIEITTSIITSTITGLFGTSLAVRYLGITSPYIRLSLLSRNITSPLAMAIASILGGDVSLAVSFVVVTGLLGANFGATILDMMKIRDPVARGLGIGAAAHGLGTAAFVQEPEAFPFAAISMALTATVATITVSVPVIRNMIIRIALG